MTEVNLYRAPLHGAEAYLQYDETTLLILGARTVSTGQYRVKVTFNNTPLGIDVLDVDARATETITQIPVGRQQRMEEITDVDGSTYIGIPKRWVVKVGREL